MVVVLALTVIIVIAALAIDVSNWYTTRHQAQVTADSAALAAANYMSTTPNATPATATMTATTIASDNNLPVSSSNVNVNTGNDTVTVTPQATGPLLFAGITLSSAPAISARAVAAWYGAECTGGGSGCAFAYAADNVCGSATETGVYGLGGTNKTPNSPTLIDNGVTINKSGQGSGPAVTGDVISASNITTYTSGTQNWPSVARYPGIVNGASTGCTGPTPASPNPFSAAVNNQSVASSFPVPYNAIYSACGATAVASTKFGPISCDGNNFPEYCSVDITGTTVYTVGAYVANAIYCDAGSGTTEDPSTWNGTINVTPQGNATYIAGTVNISFASNSNIGPASGTYGTNLLAYGADCNASRPTTCPAAQTTTTTSPAVNLTGSGTGSITGDFFTPAGVIDDSLSGNAPLTGFLEGWDVVYNANGDVTGQGPPVSSTGTFLPDWLAQ